MTASTTIVTDLTTVRDTAWSATSTNKSIAAAGPILDLPGASDLALTKAKELKLLLTQMQSSSDSGDGNYTTLTNILSSLS